jgi:hypothetical protein
VLIALTVAWLVVTASCVVNVVRTEPPAQPAQPVPAPEAEPETGTGTGTDEPA